MIEQLPWNSIYEEVYIKAISETIIVLRRGNTRKYLRISPNLLLEYVLAKNLIEQYNNRDKQRKIILTFVTEISQMLKGFPLYEGAIITFCSIMGNPPILVSHLIEQFELAKIVQQIIDETPASLENILKEESDRKKIRIALLFQDIYSARSALQTLLENYKDGQILACELLLSKENFL